MSEGGGGEGGLHAPRGVEQCFWAAWAAGLDPASQQLAPFFFYWRHLRHLWRLLRSRPLSHTRPEA